MDPDAVPVQAPQPIVYPNAQSTPEIPVKKGGKFKIILIVLFLFLLLLGGGAGLTAAIAYEKVNIDNPKIREIASKVVFSVPFAPKTPKFLLSSTALAHEKITRYGYNISLSGESNAFTSALGMTKLEGEIKGQVDVSDLTSVKQTMEISFNPDFNLELRIIKDKLYFKLNKVPQLLLTYLKLDNKSVAGLSSKWAYYDIPQSLQTEASKNLEEHKQENENKEAKEYVEKISTIITSDKILNSLVVSQESIDGLPTYKMTLKATSEIIDYLDGAFREIAEGGRSLRTDGQKLSDTIKNLDIDLFIDKEKYYLRKLTVYTKIKTPKLEDRLPSNLQVLGTNTDSVLGDEFFLSLVVNLTDFEKPFEVTIPEDPIKAEDYLSRLRSSSSLYQNTLNISLDSKVITDIELIKASLDSCFTAKQKYPRTLQELTDGYCPQNENSQFVAVPASNPVYKYSTNTFQTTYTLKATLLDGTECLVTETKSVESCSSQNLF